MKKLLALLVVALVITACGGTPPADENPPEEPEVSGEQPEAEADVDVDLADDRVTVTTEEGDIEIQATETGNLEVPETFPGDAIPIYPGARLSVREVSPDAMNLVWMTGDDVTTVYTYITENLRIDEVLHKVESQESGSIIGLHGGNTIAITVMKDMNESSEETLIGVSIAEQ